MSSLDAPLQHGETSQTLYELVERTQVIPQDTTHLDDQEAIHKIHLLSRLAGLNEKQEETLIALYVYGGDTKLIAQLRRRTPRMVSRYRQTALESLQRLGYETVNAILAGTSP